MTTRERAILRGWTGVAAVTLGTFTLVTNEFIPVGLLTTTATDMHVSSAWRERPSPCPDSSRSWCWPFWGLSYGALPVAMQTWVFTADRIKSEGGSALYISCFQISLA
jgi:predicted MFS family arabinose efflux permease